MTLGKSPACLCWSSSKMEKKKNPVIPPSYFTVRIKLMIYEILKTAWHMVSTV